MVALRYKHGMVNNYSVTLGLKSIFLSVMVLSVTGGR